MITKGRQAEPHNHRANLSDFLMVIMASSIARGYVHTTAMPVKLHKMAAILQIIG